MTLQHLLGQQTRYVGLTAAILALLVLAPFYTGKGLAADIVLAVLFVGIIVGTLRALASRRRVFRAAACFGILAILSEFAPLFSKPLGNWAYGVELVGLVAYTAFFTLMLAIVLISLFVERSVPQQPGNASGYDKICGGICGFLLLGLLWSTMYSLVVLVDPNAFGGTISTAAEDYHNILYFSYTTLTTVGYGDLVPKTPVAKMLANMEGLVGQLYLAILIARLVSEHAEQRADR